MKVFFSFFLSFLFMNFSELTFISLQQPGQHFSETRLIEPIDVVTFKLSKSRSERFSVTNRVTLQHYQYA